MISFFKAVLTFIKKAIPAKAYESLKALDSDFRRNYADKFLKWYIVYPVIYLLITNYTAACFGQNETTYTEPLTGMVFVKISKACFQMGYAAGSESDEKPYHRVCLDEFWISKHEVTNDQYRIFRPGHDSGRLKGVSLNQPDHPVIRITWHDAQSFVQFLSRQQRDNFIFSLPTEAQWEYACKAGTTTQRFWGDSAADACNFANVYDQLSQKYNKFEWPHHDCTDGYAMTSPVGRFPANAFGLHDMLGNVWEWCVDTYNESAYAKHQRLNPVYLGTGPSKVCRGGCFSDEPQNVRSTFRDGYSPDYIGPFVGFRVIARKIK